MKWCWLLCVLTACSPLERLIIHHPVDDHYHVRSDGLINHDVAKVERALKNTAKGLERWGGLPGPVTVYVVNTHADLERAVKRPGYDWLRAWAAYDSIIVQAPSTWNASDETLDRLLLHEATHCLLFQRIGTPDDWLSRNIPLWFREGMAIDNAQQHRQYPSLEDTARWIQAHPEADIFTDGEALSGTHSQPVYGFALHAYRFLEDRVGLDRLRRLLDAMREGSDFQSAFAATLGLPLDNFQRDFQVFLRLRAFRSAGKPPRVIPAEP